MPFHFCNGNIPTGTAGRNSHNPMNDEATHPLAAAFASPKIESWLAGRRKNDCSRQGMMRTAIARHRNKTKQAANIRRDSIVSLLGINVGR
jgi:hypothetical protein